MGCSGFLDLGWVSYLGWWSVFFKVMFLVWLVVLEYMFMVTWVCYFIVIQKVTFYGVDVVSCQVAAKIWL